MALSISYVDGAGVAINWGTAVVNGVATTNIYSVTADDLHSNTFLWAPSGSPVTAAQVLAARADTVPAGGKARVGTLASASDIVNTGPGQSTRYLPTGAAAGTVRGAQNNGESVILVDALGTETIDGGTNSALIQPGETVQFQSNGAGAWVRLSAANALLNGTYASKSSTWKANTPYKAGELVTQGGVVYAANTDFTSGGSFVAGNWTAVGGGGSVSDATTGAKGIVQLAGDLAGTAATPSVVKVQGRAVSATAPVGGQFLIYNTSSSQWEPSPNPSTPTNLAPLARWREALGGADFTPANVLLCGDSVTEGTGAGATTSATPATNIAGFAANRWAYRLAQILRSRYLNSSTGGAGYVPMSGGVSPGSTGWQDSTNALAYWTLTGGSVGTGSNFLNGKYWNHASGGTATLTFTGTGVDVVSFALGSATYYSYAVDGGAAVNVNNVSSTSKRQVTAQIRGLSAGQHTVVFSAYTPATTLYVQGAFCYNGDESKGIHVFDAGAYGFTSTQYVAAGGPGDAANLGSYIPSYFTPHLVGVLLGFNDYSTGVTSATFQSNLQALISRIKTAAGTPTPSFLLMTPYQRGDVTSPSEPWANYVAACSAVAGADPSNVAAISFTDRLPSPVSGNGYANGLVVNDGVHPTAQGHNFVAQSIATLIGMA